MAKIQGALGLALAPCVLFSVVARLAGCLMSGIVVVRVCGCGCGRVLLIFGGGGWLLSGRAGCGRACVMPFWFPWVGGKLRINSMCVCVWLSPDGVYVGVLVGPGGIGGILGSAEALLREPFVCLPP